MAFDVSLEAGSKRNELLLLRTVREIGILEHFTGRSTTPNSHQLTKPNGTFCVLQTKVSKFLAFGT
jgi:hypothetical protein